MAGSHKKPTKWQRSDFRPSNPLETRSTQDENLRGVIAEHELIKHFKPKTSVDGYVSQTTCFQKARQTLPICSVTHRSHGFRTEAPSLKDRIHHHQRNTEMWLGSINEAALMQLHFQAVGAHHASSGFTHDVRSARETPAPLPATKPWHARQATRATRASVAPARQAHGTKRAVESLHGQRQGMPRPAPIFLQNQRCQKAQDLQTPRVFVV